MDFEQPVGMEESGAGGSEADGAKRPGPSGLARLLIFCYCGIAGYAGVLGFARLAPARAQLAECGLRYAAAPSAWAAEGPSASATRPTPPWPRSTSSCSSARWP